MDIIELQPKTLEQLRIVAREWDIPAYSRLKKDELIVRLLRANAEIHGVDLRAFACGLGERDGRAAFTYYPHVSIVSGRYADARQEREVLAAYERGRSGDGGGEALLAELLADRMGAEIVDCALRTLSGALREEGVERIDLLKIDVEKSELDVLGELTDGIGAEPALLPDHLRRRHDRTRDQPAGRQRPSGSGQDTGADHPAATGMDGGQSRVTFRSRLMSERILPAPSTTDESGSSAT